MTVGPAGGPEQASEGGRIDAAVDRGPASKASASGPHAPTRPTGPGPTACENGTGRSAEAPAGASWWTPSAWVDGRWQDAVLLCSDAHGRWSAVTPGVPCPASATALPGAVLPGLVDAHSHAFQRAFVGRAERREGDADDFWSWRDRMYGVALRISPEQLRAVAAHLYSELLAGGYTHVCEFHYLHDAPDGRPYADPLAMSRALAEAACEAGIGLTLLPALYERAGFDADALRPDQRRFGAGVDRVLQMRDSIRGWRLPQVDAGVAVHSLRAARPGSLRALAQALVAPDTGGPVHIHVAEQTAEVDACIAATGARPIEWLVASGVLDARWQLVHATHATPQEIEGVAASGAGVVLCPGTEANLGDGVPDLRRWLAAGVPLSLGSDSHVTRSWPEELRWLEYAQRLVLRRRNVAAAPLTGGAAGQPSTAARLFEAVLAGGAAAAGWGTPSGLRVGARADLLLIDGDDPALAGLPGSHRLDGIVFAAPHRPFAGTMVAGRWVGGDAGARAAAFGVAARELHATGA